MIQLPNGCRRSEWKVFPDNYKTTKAKLTDIWYADVRFYDPRYKEKFTKGKVIRIKGGINRINNHKSRREALEFLMEEMTILLDNGHNPIEKKELPEQHIAIKPSPTDNSLLTEVKPSTPFIHALRFALEQRAYEKGTKADIRSALKSIEAAAVELDFINIEIHQIGVRHIKQCLDWCHKNYPTFSQKRFNKVKAHLSGLFRYLGELGVTAGNMASAVSPMKEKATKQVYLSDTDAARIKEHLFKYNRQFYNFVMMFYFSGARVTEMFRLQVKDVDLISQTYEVVVKKGKVERYVKRTIRNIALPFWTEQIKEAKPNDYVFSKDLLPGPTPIDPHQIGRRWALWVQKPLGIKASFYKLKHRNLNATRKALSAKMAAGQAGHTSRRMVEEVYAYEEAQLIHEGLKGLDIEL